MFRENPKRFSNFFKFFEKKFLQKWEKCVDIRHHFQHDRPAQSLSHLVPSRLINIRFVERKFRIPYRFQMFNGFSSSGIFALQPNPIKSDLWDSRSLNAQIVLHLVSLGVVYLVTTPHGIPLFGKQTLKLIKRIRRRILEDKVPQAALR